MSYLEEYLYTKLGTPIRSREFRQGNSVIRSRKFGVEHAAIHSYPKWGRGIWSALLRISALSEARLCIKSYSGSRFWQFLVLFWMLWMLVNVHKPCHVPYASRIPTSGTIFRERCFGVFKEWVRSWSHVFLITKIKTLAKKLLVVRPEKVTRRKKNKKTYNGNCKAFRVKRKRN